MCMAQRTIAGLGALSAPAVRTESLLSRPADVSAATPHHLPLPAGGGRPWQDWEEPLLGWRGGGDSVFSARGGQPGLGLAGLGRLWVQRGGSPEYHLVSCQLLSGLLFTRTLLLKLW